MSDSVILYKFYEEVLKVSEFGKLLREFISDNSDGKTSTVLTQGTLIY